MAREKTPPCPLCGAALRGGRRRGGKLGPTWRCSQAAEKHPERPEFTAVEINLWLMELEFREFEAQER